jgi:RHS repeat-associated protein
MAMKVRYTVVDGEVLSELRDGVKRDYVPDPLGSTVALLDSSQNITDTFSYWPYGESAGRTGTTATPFQYVGTEGYYTDSSGRNYVRARYLDKVKGRWITEDWLEYIDIYSYCNNSPFVYFDYSGNQGVRQKPGKKKPPPASGKPVPVADWNCYDYACNRAGNPNDGSWNPGKRPLPNNRDFNKDCNELISNARKDGVVVPADKKGGCPNGWHKVIAYLSVDGLGIVYDHHWIRMDDNGRYSDKHGDGPLHTFDDPKAHCAGLTVVDHSGNTVPPYKRCPALLCAKGKPLPPGRVFGFK